MPPRPAAASRAAPGADEGGRPSAAASTAAAQHLVRLIGAGDFAGASAAALADLQRLGGMRACLLLESGTSGLPVLAVSGPFGDGPGADGPDWRPGGEAIASVEAALRSGGGPVRLADRFGDWSVLPLLHGAECVGAVALCCATEPSVLAERLAPLLDACAAMLLWRRQQQASIDSEQRVEEERARLRSLIDSLPDPVALKAAGGLYIDCNDVFAAYLGRTRAQVVGRSTWELFPEAVAERFEQDDAEVLLRGEAISRMHWHERADTGERVLVQIHKRPLRGRDGSVIGVVMAAHDVSELHYKSEQERLSSQVFASSSEGLVITDGDGVIVAANPALLAMTGRQQADVIGLPWTELDLELGGGGPALLPPEGMRGEGWLLDTDGVRRPVWRTVAAVREKTGFARSFVLAYLNIAELVDAREHLDHIAHHDALTGLPNRMYLQKELARGIARSRVVPSAFALLFVDIDSFKTVNDSLGHSRGDQLLRAVAERLRRALRDNDLVARIGGDEFVLLLPGSHGATGAERVAAKVMSAFVDPFEVGGTILFVTPSIGISLYPQDGDDAETLIRNADAAMYAAKAAGRNCYRFYSSDLTAAAAERLRYETAMRKALVTEEFELYFQPIHHLDAQGDGGIGAAEVLLRWQSVELGAVPPDRFIPMAEATGLIVQVGEWVLSRALAQLASWRAQGRQLARLAVNVSLRQLERADFAERVVGLLRQHALAPQSLELEITETALMKQEGQGTAVAQLKALRELGVQIAIDDFGTGYSSMSRLLAMPVDRIKIDRSFFAARTEGEAADPITRAIAAIAQELGLRLTAEGVETEQLLRRAVLLGCDEAQGYHLGRPMPAQDFQRRLGAVSRRG